MYGFAWEIIDSEVPAGVRELPRLTALDLRSIPLHRRECMDLLGNL